jgi:hypothetical protein
VNDDGERGGTDGRSMKVLMPRHCACIPSLRSPNGTEHGMSGKSLEFRLPAALRCQRWPTWR